MASKIALASRQPVKQERFVPGIHSVQGINSRLTDLTIRGERLVGIIGEAVAEATLTRTISGSSTLVVNVLDPSPGRRFLQSSLLAEAHELILDGLRWKLVKVSNQGINEPISLTYEPLVVYLLRQLHGPHKSFRDQMTRAEFAQARAFEIHPRPRFIAPELHVVQDIAKASEGKKAQQEAKEARGKGIGENPGHLVIASKPATKQQIDILDRMLRVAESKSAPLKVMEALVVTCIDESVVGTLSSNLLEQEPFIGVGTDHTNPEESAGGFLDGYKTASGRSTGAIAYAKAHPGAGVAEICTAVQNNRDGATPYERFLTEGKAIVAAYGGGNTVGAVERYAFQQGKKETNWKVINRLANEVNWRCFESAGWLYFLDEPELLKSPLRMIVHDSAPGIIDTTFDYDVGKEVQTMTVSAQANVWGAPPGSVAQVSRHGPADGPYLVQQIESHPSSTSGLVSVTLKRPTEPLPEPAAKRSSTSFGSASGAPQPIQEALAECERLEKVAGPYLYGGNHTGGTPPASGRFDCSSAVSRVLYVAGLLDHVEASPALETWGQSGKGDWLTVYANATHTFIEIRDSNGWRTWQTSSSNPGSRPGFTAQRTDTGSFTARHWKGL